MPEAINYTNGLSNAWSNVATFIPKIVFLIILVVGWLIAKVITKTISAVLTRAGFDRAVERGGINKALEIAEAARNAPSVEDQARQAKDTNSIRSGGTGSQAGGVAAGNGYNGADGRYAATRY